MAIVYRNGRAISTDPFGEGAESHRNTWPGASTLN